MKRIDLCILIYEVITSCSFKKTKKASVIKEIPALNSIDTISIYYPSSGKTTLS
jgi:hypothetical protein